RSAFTAAIDAWPYSDPAMDAARVLAELPGLQSEHYLRIGRTYLRYGNEQRGLAGLRKYLDSSDADPDTAARVRFEIGRSQFAQGNYRSAEQELIALADRAPASSATPDALFLAARSQYRQSRDQEARATLQRIVRT